MHPEKCKDCCVKRGRVISHEQNGLLAVAISLDVVRLGVACNLLGLDHDMPEEECHNACFKNKYQNVRSYLYSAIKVAT